jgi:hypothetical protein
MSDNGQHAADPQAKARRLSEILREVKVAAAERDDVVVEMRDADRARLELLAQELEPVIRDVPAGDDQFDFAVSSGLEPRFWVDAVSHVQMGRDRRTYRFVRDTRLGRTVLAETSDMAEAADAVARYVAERIIQRQRILEGDFDLMLAERAAREPEPRPAPAPAEPPARRSRAFLIGLIWFFTGCILGGLAVMAAFADRIPY